MMDTKIANYLFLLEGLLNENNMDIIFLVSSQFFKYY